MAIGADKSEPLYQKLKKLATAECDRLVQLAAIAEFNYKHQEGYPDVLRIKTESLRGLAPVIKSFAKAAADADRRSSVGGGGGDSDDEAFGFVNLTPGLKMYARLVAEIADWAIGPLSSLLESVKSSFVKSKSLGPDAIDLRTGPRKGLARYEDKILEYLDEGESRPDFSAARRVLDVIRFTFAFTQPHVLAAFHDYLKGRSNKHVEKLTWTRTKNKFLDGGTALQRTNVLLNFEVAHPDDTAHTIAIEVQLTLHDHLRIKKALHLYYQIQRSHVPREVTRIDSFARSKPSWLRHSCPADLTPFTGSRSFGLPTSDFMRL